MSADPLIPENPASNSDTVNEQALYSSIMYLPLDEMDVGADADLNTILQSARDYVTDNPDAKDAEATSSYIEMIESMTTPESRTSIVMNNPSWQSNQPSYSGENPDGLLACTFSNSQTGEATIAFRGTPDKAWLDNGYSLGSPNGFGGEGASYYYTDPETGNRYGPMSEMDYATLKYTEYALGQPPINPAPGQPPPTAVNTTGHSKGGHEAMLAAVAFGGIDGCYAFDGYGVSPELYSNMAYYMGDEFDERRGRVISVNGNNDFVNGLGVSLALGENIIFLYLDDDEEMGMPIFLHDIRGMIGADGRLNGIDPNGQGCVSTFFSIVALILGTSPNARNTFAFQCNSFR